MPGRNSKETGSSEHRNTIATMHDCSGESDSDGYETPPASSGPPRPKCENGESENAFQTNEKCCSWWLKLSDKSREKRINCIRIHVLSPFLFGVVPPGQEDKVIDWSYECGLLPDKDVQQVFSLTRDAFASIHVVESAFCCLADSCADSCNSREKITNILNLKDEFIKFSSVKDAIQSSEKLGWFKTMRTRIELMACSEKDMGDMSLLLAIYHFAEHVQLSVREYDVLKRYEEDCKLAEEKALELKVQGNTEFIAAVYRSAISLYSRAVGLSPFNYIVYGNRAQSYLKVGSYRSALIDAKRALVLKADWDKGLYRFSEAAKALRECEGEDASFLSFFKAKCSLKKKPSREYSDTKRKKAETSKGRSDERFSISGDEDDTDDDEGLPD